METALVTIVGRMKVESTMGQRHNNARTGGGRLLLQLLVLVSILATGLFISLGTIDYLMAWIYLGIVTSNHGMAAVLLMRRNPELADERSRLDGKRDVDRVLAGMMAVYGPLCICIVSGLNARLQWEPSVPLEFQVLALVVACSGSLLTLLAMTVNRYFYSVLRVMPEKGHTACNSGPYRLVRHPGYLGAVLFNVATPLMLGSAWALVPAVITIVVIMIRTQLEDIALQRGLNGYVRYIKKTGYRLFPGIW